MVRHTVAEGNDSWTLACAMSFRVVMMVMVSPPRLKHDYRYYSATTPIRLSRRLIGGGSAANLKHMCAALSIGT